MTDLRSKLRHLEMLIILPTSLVVRRIVLWISGTTILGIICSIAFDLATPSDIFAVAILMLALYAGLTGKNIRPGVDYFAGNRHQESLMGWSFAVLGALVLASEELARLEERYGISILRWTPWLWIVIMIVGKLRFLDFTILRNNDPTRISVKTEEGLAQVPDQRTRERLADSMAGWLRHGLVSPEKRELLKEGLGVPPNSIWAEEEREKAMQRREWLARRDVVSAAVELSALGEGLDDGATVVDRG